MTCPEELLLVLNVGSSSLKFALYEPHPGTPREWVRGSIDTSSSIPVVDVFSGRCCRAVLPAMTLECRDVHGHVGAIVEWTRRAFPGSRIAAVGHRIVHGGERTGAARVTPSLLDALERLEPYAPMHQAPGLDVIRRLESVLPLVPQVASFDTALHMTQARRTRLYALPKRYADEGIVKYGFHGLSCTHALSVIEQRLGRDTQRRTVVAHLGSGSSVNGFVGRVSHGSTMGLTPLDGLPMATRCGSLDPGVVFALQRCHGLSTSQVEHVLYHESGLLGLSGLSGDLRVLLASPAAAAQQAVDHLVVRTAREIASMATELGGLDVLVFTGAIGSNAIAIRDRVAERLRWIGIELDAASNASHAATGASLVSSASSPVACWAVAADEERVIADEMHASLRDEREAMAAFEAD